MADREPATTVEEEEQYHHYTGNRIPWFVRLMWLGFWIFAIAYTIRLLFPACGASCSHPERESPTGLIGMANGTGKPTGIETAGEASCRHCGLPVRVRRLPSSGELYCCLGCRLAAAVSASGSAAESAGESGGGEAGQNRWTLAKLGLAVFFSMNVMVFTLALWSQDASRAESAAAATVLHDLLRRLGLLFCAPVLVLLGGPLLEGAWDSLRQRRLTTDVLLLLGVAAAFASSMISTLRGAGHVYFDVVCGVLVAVTLGRWLEANGKHKTTAALRSLQKLLPGGVRRVDASGEQQVALESLRAGDVYRVVANERIATDGQLASPYGLVDQQLLTGESQAVERRQGESLLGGSLNLDGDILVRAASDGGGGALARLVEAVEQAARQRPRIQRTADRLAAWLTPLVIALALIALAAHWQRGAGPAVMTALSVVLIACPCALAVATPLAFWAAIGAAARNQVLFRNGDALARLAGIRQVFIDKTGTLTCGEFLQRMHAGEIGPGEIGPGEIGPGEGGDADEALAIAGRLAASSVHPASSAILAELDAPRPLPGVTEQRGKGLVAPHPDGGVAALGSARLMDELQLTWPAALKAAHDDALRRGQSVTVVGWNDRVRGVFELGEQLRPDATATLAGLRRLRLPVTVLTGDHAARAAALQQTLGVTVRSELSAADKLRAVESSTAAAMVGDGANDAPALAAAAAGVALESGADVSRDNADVCLLGSQLQRLPWAVDLARRTMRTVRRNLIWTLAYNSVGLALAMTGRLHPAVAAGAMVVSSLWVIGSSLRLSLESFPATEDAAETDEPRAATAAAEAPLAAASMEGTPAGWPGGWQ